MISEKKLFLERCHQELGAKMGSFAGYNMPFSYKNGSIQEHLHARSSAALFDVSHMQQCLLSGDKVSEYINTVLPIYSEKLNLGASKYTILLNKDAGIIDDVILTRREENLYSIVLNAACAEKDLAHLRKAKDAFPSVSIELLTEHVLLALQGPKAVMVAQEILGDAVAQLRFMYGMTVAYENTELWISRGGYTGEDGFELSVPNIIAEQIFRKCVDHDLVQAVGLGARDSLRLEAGLSLYGNDITEDTNPFAAGLGFTISKKRLHEEDGMPFIGKEQLLLLENQEQPRVKVALRPEGKAMVRQGTLLYASKDENPEESQAIGEVCSGGYGASLDAPIALAYVESRYSEIDQVIWANVRGKLLSAKLSSLPFIPHQYKKTP